MNRFLPSTVPYEDLLAIARVHLPCLDKGYLQYVVETAAATERNYMSDISMIALVAQESARIAGRAQIALPDLDAAIAAVLPAVAHAGKPDAVYSPMPAFPIAQRPAPAAADFPADEEANKPSFVPLHALCNRLTNHLHADRQLPGQPAADLLPRRH